MAVIQPHKRAAPKGAGSFVVESTVGKLAVAHAVGDQG
jgi:hypothetical protein